MPTQKIGKNLPKRCSNAHAKEHRKACWAAGEVRKGKRRAEDARRHRVNLDLVSMDLKPNGKRTTWPRKRLPAEERAKPRWVIELPRDVRPFTRPDGRIM